MASHAAGTFSQKFSFAFDVSQQPAVYFRVGYWIINSIYVKRVRFPTIFRRLTGNINAGPSQSPAAIHKHTNTLIIF